MCRVGRWGIIVWLTNAAEPSPSAQVDVAPSTGGNDLDKRGLSSPWFVYLGLNMDSDVKADPSSEDALILTFTPAGAQEQELRVRCSSLVRRKTGYARAAECPPMKKHHPPSRINRSQACAYCLRCTPWIRARTWPTRPFGARSPPPAHRMGDITRVKNQAGGSTKATFSKPLP